MKNFFNDFKCISSFLKTQNNPVIRPVRTAVYSPKGQYHCYQDERKSVTLFRDAFCIRKKNILKSLLTQSTFWSMRQLIINKEQLLSCQLGWYSLHIYIKIFDISKFSVHLALEPVSLPLRWQCWGKLPWDDSTTKQPTSNIDKLQMKTNNTWQSSA